MVNLLYCSVLDDIHHIDKVNEKKKERLCFYMDMRSLFVTSFPKPCVVMGVAEVVA